MKELAKYTFFSHLDELRKRIIKILIFFIFSTVFCYIYRSEIFSLLFKPLADQQHSLLIYTNLTEVFFSYVNLALFFGFALSFPFIVIQVYLFVSPGLYKKEKKVLKIILSLSPVLFVLGATFARFLVMPIAWNFFLSFQKANEIIFQGKISEYLTLSLQLIFCFSVAFQLPILLILLKLLKIISVESLLHKRKTAIVVNFIIAGIITPPDIFSQLLLATPLLLLYEITIVILSVTEDCND